MNLNDLSEEKTRLDPACWHNKKIGNPKTKVKGGVRVNNCVPKEGMAEGWKDKAAVAALVGTAIASNATFDDAVKVGVDNAKKSHEVNLANYEKDKKDLSKFRKDLDKTNADWRSTVKEQGVAEGTNDTIYPNAEVIKSKNGKPVGEIYQDASGWGCFHYKADLGADSIESREEAIEWLKDLHDEYRQDRSLKEAEIEEMFEAMQELAEEMARRNRVSVDRVWEQFESMDDHMLYETAAWKRKEGKNKNGGLNAKGVASYRRENPGSKLQTAVTTKPSKLKPGSKAAKRRKSFCARMSGVKGPMKKPNGKPTRKALALRKWNC